MSKRDQLAAAKEHVRADLSRIRPWVFHRGKGSAAQLEIQEYWLNRSIDAPDAPRPKKLSEADQKRLFDAAMENDVNASCVLLDEIIDYLDHERAGEARSRKLPVILSKYVIVALQRHRLAISKKPGRKNVTNYTRDWLIAMWVAQLQRYGFKPTRNREEKQRESGGSIVAAVLSENGLPLTEDAVNKIWERVSKDDPELKLVK